MRQFRRVFSLLSRGQKIQFNLVVLIRLILVMFDLAGVALIGLTVSILSGIQISSSSFSQQLINSLNQQGLTNTPLVIAAIAVSFFLVKAIASIFLNYWVARYVSQIESVNTVAAYRGLLNSNLDYLDKHRPNDLLHGVTGSANMAFSQMLLSTSVIIGEFALLIAISAYLFITDALLFWIMGLFFLCFTIALNYFVNRKTKLSSERLQGSSLRLARTLLEAVPMLRQIRFSGNSEQFVKEFQKLKLAQASSTADLMAVGFLPRYITEVALMVGLASLIALRSGGWLVSVGAPELAIFAGGAFRVVASILPLQAALANMKRAGVECEQALSMVRNFQEIGPRKYAAPKKPKKIVFSNVSYRYESQDEQILDGISFQIPSGSFVLIEGRSGAGKSTMADLMLGLRTPTKGKITIGSQSPKDFLSNHPTAIGYMPQKPEYFSGTIRQNLTLCFDGESENPVRVTAAVLDSGLRGALLNLPLGLDTALGESGIELSGGQAQRLALARVLYQDPSIILLDESTSALDLKNQEFVIESLSKLVPQKTIIVISHSQKFRKFATLRIIFKSTGIRVIHKGKSRKT